MTRPPLIVSYYTRGTPYEQEAERLCASLCALDLPHKVEGIRNRGNWSLNCNQKPGFIRDHLHAGERPVLWVDADAEVIQVPQLQHLSIDGYDFAAHWRNGKELLSGTTWWNFTKAAFDLLTAWERASRRDPGVWDQKHLEHAVRMVPGLKADRLPAEYTWIEDLFRYEQPDARPVIVHHQAARRLRSIVNGRVRA
jgi:hypothetical protein